MPHALRLTSARQPETASGVLAAQKRIPTPACASAEALQAAGQPSVLALLNWW